MAFFIILINKICYIIRLVDFFMNNNKIQLINRFSRSADSKSFLYSISRYVVWFMCILVLLSYKEKICNLKSNIQNGEEGKNRKISSFLYMKNVYSLIHTVRADKKVGDIKELHLNISLLKYYYLLRLVIV